MNLRPLSGKGGFTHDLNHMAKMTDHAKRDDERFIAREF
jgi:hypothetical protein